MNSDCIKIIKNSTKEEDKYLQVLIKNEELKFKEYIQDYTDSKPWYYYYPFDSEYDLQFQVENEKEPFKFTRKKP